MPANEQEKRPDSSDAAHPARNTDQLRDEIDSGRTQDKVAHPDPAAAPLGTDAEAGGVPPTREEIRMASREESSRIGAEEEPPALRDARRAMRPPYGTILWAVILVIGAAIVLSIML